MLSADLLVIKFTECDTDIFSITEIWPRDGDDCKGKELTLVCTVTGPCPFLIYSDCLYIYLSISPSPVPPLKKQNSLLTPLHQPLSCVSFSHTPPRLTLNIKNKMKSLPSAFNCLNGIV